MMYCQQCGAEGRPGFRFCPKCGGTQYGPQQAQTPVSGLAAAAATANPALPPIPAPPFAAAGGIDVSAMQYAGFWRRAASLVLDQLFTGVVVGIPLVIALVVLGGGTGVNDNLYNFLALIGVWVYYAVLESGQRQATWGKRVMGLVVSDMNGQRLSFGRASGRFWGHLLSCLFLGIGFFMALFTERRQTLHDKLAGTVVLYRGA